jgi:hypothetical protein
VGETFHRNRVAVMNQVPYSFAQSCNLSHNPPSVLARDVDILRKIFGVCLRKIDGSKW